MAHPSAALQTLVFWKELKAVAGSQTHQAVDVKEAKALEGTPCFG
jgi:hypothetical protein